MESNFDPNANDDDAPLAVAGSAPGVSGVKKSDVKKKGGIPPWAVLVIGGGVVASVLLFFFIGMLRAPSVRESQAGHSDNASNSSQVVAPPPVATASAPAGAEPTGFAASGATTGIVNLAGPAASSVAQPNPTQVAMSAAAPAANVDLVLAQNFDRQAAAHAAANAQQIVLLQERLSEVEQRFDQLAAALTGQPVEMRRIITDRVNKRLRANATTPRVDTASEPQVREVPLRVSGDFSVHAVVGTRAWLRPVNDSGESEVIVTHGDLVNGSQVKEVQSAGKRVILENGSVIQ
jgi:hypothetical protein